MHLPGWVVRVDAPPAELGEQRCEPLGPERPNSGQTRSDGQPVPQHVTDRQLTTPAVFAEEWEAAASLGLRAGQSDAVQAYADHGRLSTTHPALEADQVARAHQAHTADGRSVAITTNTAETARAINREIQWSLRTGRKRGVRLHDGTTAHPGDQIATRRNDPHLRTDTGERVRNRHTWTVTHVNNVPRHNS